MTASELVEFKKAVSAALAANPDIAQYGGVNSVDSIVDAYTTNDWSGIVDVTGIPFTQEQQQAAVQKAERALAPAYQAQEVFDRSVVTDSLDSQRQGLDEFRDDETRAFEQEKMQADQSAADQGVLFAGSRFQKNNNMRDNYRRRDQRAADTTRANMGNTARSYQYKYGNEGVKGIGDMLNVGGQNSYNANMATGGAQRGRGLSSVYNPSQFNFQGTAPVSQKAAVQTRAAGLLQNTANKLTSTGYKNKL